MIGSATDSGRLDGSAPVIEPLGVAAITAVGFANHRLRRSLRRREHAPGPPVR